MTSSGRPLETDPAAQRSFRNGKRIFELHLEAAHCPIYYRVAEGFGPGWIPRSVASVFVLAAFFIFLSVWRTTRRTKASLIENNANVQTDGHMGLVSRVSPWGPPLPVSFDGLSERYDFRGSRSLEARAAQ